MSNRSKHQNMVWESVSAAAAHLERNQDEDGAWRMYPEPRILENALFVAIARTVPALGHYIDRVVTFLAAAHPQQHHPIAECIDRWLMAVAIGNQPTLDLTHPTFEEKEFASRKLFFNVLAYFFDCPIEGGISREALTQQLMERIRSRRESQQKAWTNAEFASLWLLLCPPHAPAAADFLPEAIETISEAQAPSGSIAENPLSTLIAVAALHRHTPTAATLDRALEYLHVQLDWGNGTLRFATAEVWDTALLMRVFRSSDILTPDVVARAFAFLQREQRPDGGWSYRPNVESDTDTTSMAILALDLPQFSNAVDRGASYLTRMQTDEGLWRTWHYREDPPVEDAVAHAVMALDRLQTPATQNERAKIWLADRFDPIQGWRAHWYNIRPYAAHEIGEALGILHPLTCQAAKQLLALQNEDGGFAAIHDTASTSAATGMAIALLCHYLEAESQPLQRAVEYLLDRQDRDGLWGGATAMYGPRPFEIDYNYQSHALAAIGMLAANTERTPSAAARLLWANTLPSTATDLLSVGVNS